MIINLPTKRTQNHGGNQLAYRYGTNYVTVTLCIGIEPTTLMSCMVVVWCSDSVIGRINEITYVRPSLCRDG